MKYRLTCLTPTLVGDGSRLSPIDYMVWKDQVNVLDQARIFRLLAKGPRLDNYLKQICRADKLEFASWGGFAQNFAHRRIPFESAEYTKFWEALPCEHLHIPTFNASAAGPYIPGSAVKGALRTGLVSDKATEGAIKAIASRAAPERAPRNPGLALEDQIVGKSGHSRVKTISVGDSDPIERSHLKVFLLRTASLEKAPESKLALQWKRSPKGGVDGNRPDESTPIFAEMAAPETVFEGNWRQNPFYQEPDVVRALRWKEPLDTVALLGHANNWAEKQLAAHRLFARIAGLPELDSNLEILEKELGDARRGANSCLLCLGWGGGFLNKSGGPETTNTVYREFLEQFGFYSRTIRAGLPFPKTRRVVFLNNRPATLAGWTVLEIL